MEVAAQMRAAVADGIRLAIDVRKENLFPLRLDALGAAYRDLRESRHAHKFGHDSSSLRSGAIVPNGRAARYRAASAERGRPRGASSVTARP